MNATPLNTISQNRLASIDVFRALTMLLMIFVNDLWTLKDIPLWLEHATAQEDKLGFADTIFPAFLFIVGLSIPFAITHRLQKGDTPLTLSKHILLRSLALILMGVFHVNLEDYSPIAFLPKAVWEIFITVGFFLIWLDYSKGVNRAKKYVLQGSGWIILLIMALLYQGGSPEHPVWMKFHWWGILGLIGWAYLVGSFVFLAFRDKVVAYIVVFVFFVSFNSAGELGWLKPISPVRPYLWFLGDGSTASLVVAGIIISLYYSKLMAVGRQTAFWLLLGAFSLVMLSFGFLTRPLWGINKISATPSWVTICIGLSVIVFGGLIWLVDRQGKKDWFKLIKPAGTSTLTSYLLPYLYYPVYSLVGISLPLVLRTGVVGIVKSLLFAVLIILITGLLETRKIRLKL
jgi:predicted acyltransferase